MRLGFALPQVGNAAGPEAVSTVATRAEELGYDSLWVLDRLLYPEKPRAPYPVGDGTLPVQYKTSMDPLQTLAFAAANTKRIAVGTSIPELVVSVTSATKGQTDHAIGNIIGSNIFNILAVLAIPAIISPSDLMPLTLWRDYAVMLGLTLALVVFAYGLRGDSSITRFKGFLLFMVWLSYITYLYQTALNG